MQAIRSLEGSPPASVELLRAVDGIDTNQVDMGAGHVHSSLPRSRATPWVQHLLGAAGVAVNHTEGHEAEGKAEGGMGIEFTALMHAAAGGHAECVRALLTADGIDVNTVPERVPSVQDHGMTGSPPILTIRCRNDGWKACSRALASAKGVDLNYRHQQNHGRPALREVCKLSVKHAALAEHLLVAGGCRFTLTTAGQRWAADFMPLNL